MVIGRKTMFVRLAGCDYRCVWCDSAFTWDGSAKEEIRMMSAQEAVEALRETGGETFAHVTISGGNPALYPQVGELIERLHERDIRVAVETQGSRWQDWFPAVDELTLSPEPPSSGMVADWRVLDEIVDKLEVAMEEIYTSETFQKNMSERGFGLQYRGRDGLLDWMKTHEQDTETVLRAAGAIQ